eukprot:764373-Hanusia_phi.AAC.2
MSGSAKSKRSRVDERSSTGQKKKARVEKAVEQPNKRCSARSARGLLSRSNICQKSLNAVDCQSQASIALSAVLTSSIPFARITTIVLGHAPEIIAVRTAIEDETLASCVFSVKAATIAAMAVLTASNARSASANELHVRFAVAANLASSPAVNAKHVNDATNRCPGNRIMLKANHAIRSCHECPVLIRPGSYDVGSDAQLGLWSVREEGDGRQSSEVVTTLRDYR